MCSSRSEPWVRCLLPKSGRIRLVLMAPELLDSRVLNAREDLATKGAVDKEPSHIEQGCPRTLDEREDGVPNQVLAPRSPELRPEALEDAHEP